MADRRGDVELLLATRFDHLWLPPGSLRTQPGLAPADRRPCVTCGGVEIRDDFGKLIRRRRGTGKVRDRFRTLVTCPTCRGDGWTARDRMDSSRTVLGSTETSSSARPRKTVLCDACAGEGATAKGRCERCQGTGRRDLHVFELHLDTHDVDGDANPVLDAIARRDQTGSYHELDLALDGVVHHVNKPARYAGLRGRSAVQARRLIDVLYTPPPDVTLAELSPFGQLLVGVAIGYIESRMPDPIRVPADVRHAARARVEQLRRAKGRSVDARARSERDRQARVWAREGRPYPWIAAELGLSAARLRTILRDDTAAA